MITKKLLLPSLMLVLLLMSCSKEKTVNEQDRQTTEQAGQEYLLAEAIFEDVFKIVDNQAKQEGDLNEFTVAEDEIETRGNCPEKNLTFTDNTLFPATLNLDFGSGCSIAGSPEIAGEITAVFNGLLLKAGTSISVGFSDFVHNGYGVTGTYDIVNQGKDADGQWTFSSVIDGQVLTPAGKTIAYQALTTSKQTEGNDTNFFTHGIAGILDDVWSATREATLTTSDGLEVEVSTPQAVNFPVICRWPVSGALSMDVKSLGVTGGIDFGTGNCDNKAMLTIGDYSVEITL